MIVLGLILTLIGALLIAAYVGSVVRCRTAVEATISRFEEKKLPVRGGTRTEITPVFTYTVGNKVYHTKAAAPVWKFKHYSVGQRLTVFIDPKHPQSMRFGSNLRFLLIGLVFAAMGCFVVVLTFM